MSKTFEEMTKAELQKAAELYKVTEKVEELSKEEAIAADKPVPKVPTNETYIKVLNALKDEKDEEVGMKAEEGEPVRNKPAKSAAQVRKDFAMTKENVTVTDHNNNQTTDEELEDLLIPVRWGNKSGRYTDHIPVHGQPTHVRAGALDILKQATMTLNQKNKSGRRERFKISAETPFTEADLTALAEKQESRKVR